MIVESITSGSAAYSAPNNSTIDCMVKFAEFPQPLPYTASATDVEPHGQSIWAKLQAGDAGTIKPYVARPGEVRPVITAKADIWRRCTDLEAQMLDGALADAPAQLRRIFDAAQYIDHSDAFFPVLRSAITDVLGQPRADELLAGS